MKPYKSATPQDTIHRIRTILHELGIFTTELHLRNEGMYYSCRVFIDNDDMSRFDIGTNGKGMSGEYALASAYAELMERIENRMLIPATKYASPEFRRNNEDLNVSHLPEFGFRYFPDETLQEITSEELWNLCCRLLPNVARHGKRDIGKTEKYWMYFADFYNASTRSVERLPYHLLRMAASSTGLCAGNIPEEAILQGLNEIFERYVLQQFYLQRLTPPTIPLEIFQGTDIFFRLKRLQAEKGWTIEVKDCSLGKGFPVVGLLIIDRAKNRYAFRLGADLSPVIALQRCFTEAFQGADSSERYLRPIQLDDDWSVGVEHNQSVVNGMGRFPRQLFGDKPSWAFDGFQLEEQASHHDDLLYIKKWLESKGFTLFIRDNSFLGFPAYQIFIPGLSEVDGALYDVISDLQANNDGFFKVKKEYRLKSVNTEEARDLIRRYANSSQREIKLFPFNSNRFNYFNRQLLLALLSYYVGNDNDAYRYMKSFLEEKASEGIQQDSYYYCVRDMFYAKTLYTDDSEIISMLSVVYSSELAKDVLNDMADRKLVLQNFPLPDCFNCDSCKIRNNCSCSRALEIERRMQEAQKKANIDQHRLAEVFC